jgi:regulation of enolase protein 1 (concanavalin A-like superfamily)
LAGSGYRFQWNFKNSTAGGAYTMPNAWIKLTRVGNVLSAYKSTNGTTWTRFAQNTVTMNSSATIGLFVTSGNPGALSKATFDNVSVVP